jgi:hypothetical protein
MEDNDGLAVTVYHKFDEKYYMKLSCNIKNDSIEKGDWVNSKFLDTYFDLPIQINYRYIRSALKLATKRIKYKKVKLFNGEEWFKGSDARHRIKDYYKDDSVNQVYLRDAIKKESLKENALEFLKSIHEYIKLNNLTGYHIEPENGTNHIGWIGDDKNETFYLLPKKLNDWIKKHGKSFH